MRDSSHAPGAKGAFVHEEGQRIGRVDAILEPVIIERLPLAAGRRVVMIQHAIDEICADRGLANHRVVLRRSVSVVTELDQQESDDGDEQGDVDERHIEARSLPARPSFGTEVAFAYL